MRIDGVADFGDRLRIGPLALEKAAVSADQFVAAIACEVVQGLVAEDDRIVVLLRIGDDLGMRVALNAAAKGSSDA